MYTYHPYVQSHNSDDGKIELFISNSIFIDKTDVACLVDFR